MKTQKLGRGARFAIAGLGCIALLGLSSLGGIALAAAYSPTVRQSTVWSLISQNSLYKRVHREALWYVVSACTMAKSTLGVAYPCVAVKDDSKHRSGYAIIRSPNLKTEVLVVPTRRVPGIESPVLDRSSSSHYWEAAWQARKLNPVVSSAHAPREAVGLAVNSLTFRTQDQLHIHVDCVQESVQESLARYASSVRSQWAIYPEKLEGQVYWARSVRGDDLAEINPVSLVAKGIPGVASHMSDVTLAVIGTTLPDGAPGFYLLANTKGRSAERLLDHRCSQYVLEAAAPGKSSNPREAADDSQKKPPTVTRPAG